MKICPECGASNSDDYKFCMACGATLGNETVPDAEVPAAVPVPSAPASILPTDCGATLNEIMSGKSVLAAAILLTAAFVLSVLSVLSLGSVFSSLHSTLESLLGSLYQQGVIPFSDMNGIFEYGGIDPSAITANFNVNLSVNIAGLVAPVLAWIVWGTARSKKLSSTVFVILKVLGIIALVFIGIFVVAVAVAAAVLFANIGQLAADPTFAIIRGFITGILVAVFAMLAFAFAAQLGCVNTLGSISKALKAPYNGKISVLAAAVYMCSGVSSVLFSILGAGICFGVSPLLILSPLGSICTGVANIIIGYVIIKTKTLLAKEQ